MGTAQLPKKPARSTKTAKSASGKAAVSREYEDLPKAVARMVEEETAHIIQNIIGKSPSGDGDDFDTKSLQEKLSGLIDRHYRELSGRLAAAAVRDEAAVGMRQTPASVAQLLRSMGGDASNASEGEKPAAKKGKAGKPAAAPLSAAVSVVKCHFRDNALKPKTVTDVKFAVNITEPELISPAVFDYAAAKYLIKDIICRSIVEKIDREDNMGAEQSAALLDEIDGAGFDPPDIHGNIARSAGLENVRAGGFSMTHNALVAVLDKVKLDYQCVENNRSGREAAIREYEDSEIANLPDERYAIRLRYFNEEQLVDERAAYDARSGSFEREVQLLWDLIEVNYRDSKPVFKVHDFEDLAKKNKGRLRDLHKQTGGAPAQEIVREPAAVRFARMRERLQDMYKFLYPAERRIMEDRLAWLENENARLDFMIDPHCLRPGLLIDVDMTSIKRRKTTLNALAAALSEFLRSVFGCFNDAGAAVV
jgi:hypothetical protein